MMLNSFFIHMATMINILVSLAFVTLMERKTLSYMQFRKGPNKLSLCGLTQPFSDAVKLINKESTLIKNLNYLMYIITPITSLMIMLIMWMFMPNYYTLLFMEMEVLIIISILSMSVYMTMVSGWSSNSMYSILGAMRSVAQTISYEISLIIILMNMLMLTESFNFMMFMSYQNSLMWINIHWPLATMMYVSMLAELNRTPFDLSEGESELVSGFNTEYMSGMFAIIFMSEYGMIMLMSFIFTIMFISSPFSSYLLFMNTTFIIFNIIWTRGTFPRYRYDKVMMLIWKEYLPAAINYINYMITVKMYMMLKLSMLKV